MTQNISLHNKIRMHKYVKRGISLSLNMNGLISKFTETDYLDNLN